MNQSPNRANGFATASLIMGILAILSAFTMTIVPPMVLGCLSIILGLLSRGDTRLPHNYALIGIITSASAIVINIAISILAFQFVFKNPEALEMYHDTINETYEQMLGFTFDEFLEEFGLGGELE